MKQRILIVDEQAMNRSILKNILTSSYDVEEAENGAAALDMLRNEGDKIALIILDLVMQAMDGYEFLSVMAKDEAIANIPVIAVTQMEQGFKEERALFCGARDYISRPYHPAVLLRRIENIIALHEYRKRIKSIERDALTGVFTKEAFFNRISEILANNSGGHYSMIATNIERFKIFNDVNGMERGDQLLQTVAKELEEYITAYDGICGRFSSDHFMMMIPRENEDGFLEQILSNPDVNLSEKVPNLHVLIKYGIYHIDERDIAPDMMYDRAKMATESIKGQYDVIYACYNDAMRQRLLREQRISGEMHKALLEEQFQVYFQPKYDLESGCIAGAEALVRWNHPEFGFLGPNEFIPLFEQNGFITELDQFVWRKTCAVIAEWITMGNKYVPVSVNVSRKDIYHANLPEFFADLVQQYGLKPKHLHLEITETAYTQDAAQLIRVVNELRELGFMIEMDDFGSGYSSLNMLSELPIDILKLDMRFIQKETEKNENRNILSFIISMAKWMHLSVVAEGVETEEQIEVLRNMDCDYVQGYYYAKPMPEKNFTRLVMSSILIPDTKDQVKVVLDNEQGRQQQGNVHTLLIVDDMETNREILRECFKNQYKIIEAENGLEAYNYIQNHFDEIEVVLLDLLMPVMDGYEVLKRLQANALYSLIPIIVTSQVDAKGETLAFELGADDFLKKPYDVNIAQHRVRNVTAMARVERLRKENEMMRKLQKVSLESRMDQLTGAYNRTELEKAIRSFFGRKGQQFGILAMISIDDLEMYNTILGRDVGDEILRKVTSTLFQEFDGDDVVSRLGGAEFAAFSELKMEPEQLRRRIKLLCSHLHYELQGYIITCTIGVSVAPEYGTSYEELYQRANEALLEAKREGKDTFVITGLPVSNLQS